MNFAAQFLFKCWCKVPSICFILKGVIKVYMKDVCRGILSYRTISCTYLKRDDSLLNDALINLAS